MHDRVRADRNALVDVGGSRILNGDARRHQLVVLSSSHDGTHFRQLRPTVDAEDLVRMRNGQGRHRAAALLVNRDEIRQVVLALRVISRDRADGLEEAVEGEGVDTGIDLPNLPFC